MPIIFTTTRKYSYLPDDMQPVMAPEPIEGDSFNRYTKRWKEENSIVSVLKKYCDIDIPESCDGEGYITENNPCPFCKESNTLSVNSKKGVCWCKSCNVGGDGLIVIWIKEKICPEEFFKTKIATPLQVEEYEKEGVVIKQWKQFLKELPSVVNDFRLYSILREAHLSLRVKEGPSENNKDPIRYTTLSISFYTLSDEDVLYFDFNMERFEGLLNKHLPDVGIIFSSYSEPDEDL